MPRCALQLQEDRRVGAREHLGSPWSISSDQIFILQRFGLQKDIIKYVEFTAPRVKGMERVGNLSTYLDILQS